MDAKDIRVSDAEREYVGQLLQRAVGQGMLSIAEFTERMDTAMAARTRGELNSVLIDLPGVTWRPEPGVDWRAAAGGPGPGGPLPGGPLPANGPVWHGPTGYPPSPVGHPAMDQLPGARITGTMSTTKRGGTWEVPPTMEVRTRFNSTKLDFNRAVLHSPVVRIHIDDLCSSTKLVVPPEATVDCAGVDSLGSTVDSKVRSAPVAGQLHFVVTGKVRFGSLTVRYPHSEKLRKLMS